MMNETKTIGEEKVKKIRFGTFVTKPEVGKFAILVRDDETVKTSPVEKFKSFYDDRVWIVETANSIYVLKKDE